MPTVSFKQAQENKTAAPVVEVESEVTQAPAVQTTHELATQLDSNNELDGFGSEDVRLPRVNLIHKTSGEELIEQFGIGAFTLAKQVLLAKAGKPFACTVLRARKNYQQKLPFGSEERPNVFNTPEEVIANGGSLNTRDKDSGQFYQPQAHIQLVIPAPEGVSEEDLAHFPYEFKGVSYALAIWTVSSSAYTSVGKELATLKTSNKVMREALYNGALTVQSRKETSGQFNWQVPVLKFVGKNDPELAQFFAGLL